MPRLKPTPVEQAHSAIDHQKKLDDLKVEFRKAQARKGHFKIPPLLEQRRIEANIPDGFFEFQMAFDRILIFQLSQDQGETYGDTLIIKPEAVAAVQHREAPKGVLVGAGLRALDNLKSNGIDVGHVITFINNAPWHMRLGNIKGHDYYGLVMRDGDITGSEDLATNLQEGNERFEITTYQKDGLNIREHHYVDAAGFKWAPQEPFTNESF